MLSIVVFTENTVSHFHLSNQDNSQNIRSKLNISRSVTGFFFGHALYKFKHYKEEICSKPFFFCYIGVKSVIVYSNNPVKMNMVYVSTRKL